MGEWDVVNMRPAPKSNEWEVADMAPAQAPNAGLSAGSQMPIPEGLRSAPPGVIARFSQMWGSQTPLDQAVSEAVQFGDHPLDTSLKAGKQVVLGARDLAYNATVHPLDTARTITGGPQFAEDIKNKNYRGAFGTLLGGASQVLAGKLMSGGAGPATSTEEASMQALNAPQPRLSINRGQAVNDVTKALDLNPKGNPEIRGLLNDQIDSIANAAHQQGKSVKSKADMLQVIKDAAAQDGYRKTYIEPNADLTAQAPMNYKGELMNDFSPVNRTASISQLDKRLSTINDTLNPKFRKSGGGTAADASIGAEEAQSLMAEKDAIRDVIAGAIGKKMGVDPNIIMAARKNWGELNRLHELVQLSVDTSGRISSDGVPLSKHGIISRVADELYSKPKANRMVKRTFLDYDPQVEVAPEPNPPAPTVAKPRTPLWKANPASGKPFAAVEETPFSQGQAYQDGVVARGQARAAAKKSLAEQILEGKQKANQQLAARQNMAKNRY